MNPFSSILVNVETETKNQEFSRLNITNKKIIGRLNIYVFRQIMSLLGKNPIFLSSEGTIK
jgi:hypothetical protein